MSFKLINDFTPTGDQPNAINELVKGLNRNEKAQTLLGVTGSGKTFTIANVIEKVQKPTLILSHNKTLAAQLYGEFKHFFPNNSVEYFISYYDYYQPEAFIPTSGLYIEKDLSINEEIEKLRLHTTSTLLSGIKDVIVVASVSCIYGIGNPKEFKNNTINLVVGQQISRNNLLFSFTDILYSRTEIEFKRGTFRVKGDTIDLFVAYADFAFRITFWGDEIEKLQIIDPLTGRQTSQETTITIYPANLFITDKNTLPSIINHIQDDMMKRISYFEEEGQMLEAKRIKERTEFDIEMMRELGYCPGIENYSRYFDKRKVGDRPFCLLDYFPNDFLMIIDESHATIPQIKAMWGGDRARKVNLVEYGFRLPAALDNRPLTFNEFQSIQQQTIYVSATPANFELEESEGVVVEQIIRPTGLLDPEITIRSSINQIDDLLDEIHSRVKIKERVLITTLTKRMAEELTKFLDQSGIECRYIHSEVNTLERVKILRELRLGIFDVLIGVNLLREGLDLPEVSLVAILDADKEGFLRNIRSLVQTIGRAARNAKGKVIMYADKVTKSMQISIDETNNRRKKQMDYNLKNNIIPTTILKSREAILSQTKVADAHITPKSYSELPKTSVAADPVIAYMTKPEIKKQMKLTQKNMEKSAKELDFIMAAKFRDELVELKNLLKKI